MWLIIFVPMYGLSNDNTRFDAKDKHSEILEIRKLKKKKKTIRKESERERIRLPIFS